MYYYLISSYLRVHNWLCHDADIGVRGQRFNTCMCTDINIEVNVINFMKVLYHPGVAKCCFV